METATRMTSPQASFSRGPHLSVTHPPLRNSPSSQISHSAYNKYWSRWLPKNNKEQVLVSSCSHVSATRLGVDPFRGCDCHLRGCESRRRRSHPVAAPMNCAASDWPSLAGSYGALAKVSWGGGCPRGQGRIEEVGRPSSRGTKLRRAARFHTKQNTCIVCIGCIVQPSQLRTSQQCRSEKQLCGVKHTLQGKLGQHSRCFARTA